MKGRQILIALAVLAVLSAYLYFFGIKKKADEQKAKDEEAVVFPGLQKNDITQLTLKTSKVKVVAKRSGNDWDITEPLRLFGDNGMLDTVAGAFAGAKSDRKIEGAVFADYGLNTPTVYAELTAKDGKTYTLFMADYTPTRGSAYAARSGNTTVVYTVQSDLRAHLDRDLKDFRFKGAVKIDDDKLTKIIVDLKDKKYTLEKSGGAWSLTAPVRKFAKLEKAQAITNDIKNGTAKGFENTGDAAKYGLLSPVEYIKVFEGGKTQTVYFGLEDKKKNSVYLKCDIQPDIVEMPNYVYDSIPKMEETINKQVIVFTQDKVEKASLKYGQKSFIASRNAPNKSPEWVFTEWKGLDRGKEKESRVNFSSILGALYWMEFKEAIEKPDMVRETADYQVHPGNAELVMWGKDGKKIGTFIIGGKVKGRDEVYVKVPETNTVYTVSAGSIKNMNLPGFEIK
jgi:hypothetical protein